MYNEYMKVKLKFIIKFFSLNCEPKERSTLSTLLQASETRFVRCILVVMKCVCVFFFNTKGEHYQIEPLNLNE